MQVVAALLSEWEADEAAAVLGHEIDGFGSDFLGGHGEVAFVFAVLIVDQDHHAALANFFDSFLYSSKWVGPTGHANLKRADEFAEDRLKSVALNLTV